MALWRIVVKNSGNAACKDKRQRLEKGMFIETSTVSPIPPIGVSRERPMLAQLFLNKYGIEVNVNNMNSGYFNCEKIGWWLKVKDKVFDSVQILKQWLLRKITSSDHFYLVRKVTLSVLCRCSSVCDCGGWIRMPLISFGVIKRSELRCIWMALSDGLRWRNFFKSSKPN